MDPSPSHRERAINWKLLLRSLRRPGPWLAIAAVLLAASLLANAHLWNQRAVKAPASAPEGRFRFDEVRVVERAVAGNHSTLEVIAWFSNSGRADLGPLEFVLYAVDLRRGVAVNQQGFELPSLAARSTTNGSLMLALNHTLSYRLDILVLHDGFLVARGTGSLGPHSSDNTSAVRFAPSHFHYTYTDP
jgi:hypothetical protein